MKQKLLLIILFSSLCIGTFCQEREKAKLVYGAEGILLPVAAKCTPESFECSFGEELNFLTTYDDIFLSWLSFYVERMEMDSLHEKNIDPRLMLILYNETSQNDTLYLGEYYGIYKNGVIMKDDNNFRNLIKRKIGWGGTHIPLESDSLLYPPSLP